MASFCSQHLFRSDRRLILKAYTAAVNAACFCGWFTLRWIEALWFQKHLIYVKQI